MAEVFFSPEIALEQYKALRRDPRRARVLHEVDRILDALEDDPDQTWLRSHRFQDPPLWCVKFDADGEAWVILWSHQEGSVDRILMDYIGFASFA